MFIETRSRLFKPNIEQVPDNRDALRRSLLDVMRFATHLDSKILES